MTRAAGALYGANKKFTSPPLSPADTPHLQRYEVLTPASGAFTGHEGTVAIWNADTSTWSFLPIIPGEPALTEFGGLHLADTPAKVPDGWAGPWPSGAPGVHLPTKADGTFKVDEYNGSGRAIHRVDEPLLAANLLTDGDMEDPVDPGPGRPWQLVGTPTTCVKVTAPSPVHSLLRSTHIQSLDPSEGIYQDFPTVVTRGFQAAVRGYVYVVDGCAVIRLIDQDGSTVLAELRRNFPANQWLEFTLHAWSVGPGLNPPRVQILTGPAGGEFYVDDVAAYYRIVPWSQWGCDRSMYGRTGGYTQGGSPDEYWAFTAYAAYP